MNVLGIFLVNMVWNQTLAKDECGVGALNFRLVKRIVSCDLSIIVLVPIFPLATVLKEKMT